MPKNATLLLAAPLLWALAPAAAVHAAAPCFELVGERGGSASSSRRVTLATRVQPVGGCEYALTPDGPFRALERGAEGPADFASLVLALAGAGAPDKPQSVFARRTGRSNGSRTRLESVFLAGCSEYLLSGRAFTMRVPLETQRPTIERLSAGAGDSCGAEALALRFVALAGADAALVRTGPWDAALPPGEPQLTLEPGRFGIYAARAEADAGLLIGRIESGSSQTPLRAALRAIAEGKAPERPWVRARWSGGHMLLEPTSDALLQGELWLELRGAAAAGHAWLAAGDSGPSLGALTLGPGGTAVHMPASYVEQQMRERYGAAAAHLVPSMADWEAMQAGLSLCVAHHYAGPKAVAGAVAPPATCAALTTLRAPLSVRGGSPAASGRVCLKRRTWLVGAETSMPGPEHGESCLPLATGSAPRAETALPLAAVGDQLTFAGTSVDGLFLCRDNACEAMPAPGTWLTLAKPGLWEVRGGETAPDATARHGLTLLRVGVIDPRSQWHPVGLYDDDRHEGDKPEKAPADRWSVLEHDESEVFSYVRSRNDLEFRLSTSRTLAAVLNATPSRGPPLRAQLPVITRRVASFDTPPQSALVVLATRTSACPIAASSAVPEGELVDPDRLVADQRFYLHLARYRGAGEPYRCLATAGMRVTDALSMPVSERVRLGLLGDTQAVLFVNRPAGFGAALPLAYAQLRLPYGLGLDASASLTAAAAFDDATITRAGVGFSGTLFWGPPELAPRLLSGGVMLHAATGTNRRKPTASLIAALNLSTLIDVVGGR